MPQPTRKPTGTRSSKPQAKPAKPGRWRNGPIPVIGMIGGIGAGKTLVGSMLGERGAIVIEADTVGHSLMNQRPARDRIVQRFGSKVLDLNQSTEAQPPIDRKALGAIVFNDPTARRDLEAILHPAMLKTFERVIDRATRQPRTTAVIIDAAILFEAGWNQLCDAVLFVDCPREVRLSRLSATRGWTADVLEAREKAQLPLDDKKKLADHVIENDGDVQQLQAKVEDWWSSLMSPSRGGPRNGGRKPTKKSPPGANSLEGASPPANNDEGD